MSGQPTITVQLDLATDELLAMLPGPDGQQRAIRLRHTLTANADGSIGGIDALETIRRILEAQAQSNISIGTDGAPTQAQVDHWQRHQIWAKAGCAFCAKEGRYTADDGGTSKWTSRGEVKVRRITADDKRKARNAEPANRVTTKSAKALGFA